MALLFVHLGLDAADSVVSGYTGAEVLESYKRDAAILPEDERRIMVLMALFSFMPRLNCVARSLPPSLPTNQPCRYWQAWQRSAAPGGASSGVVKGPPLGLAAAWGSGERAERAIIG